MIHLVNRDDGFRDWKRKMNKGTYPCYSPKEKEG